MHHKDIIKIQIVRVESSLEIQATQVIVGITSRINRMLPLLNSMLY
jgi:hypothetical protein